MELLVAQLLNGLVYGVLLFLMAAGLSLIFGLMNVVSLAHGSFFMLGAYVGLSIFRLNCSRKAARTSSACSMPSEACSPLRMPWPKANSRYQPIWYPSTKPSAVAGRNLSLRQNKNKSDAITV